MVETMTKSLYLLLLLGLAQQPAAAAEPEKQDVLVSAAASLKDVMLYSAPLFEKVNPGFRLVFNFGASGQLKSQIESGAPVDVFISAAASDMDAVERAGLAVEGTRGVLANNSLVLVKNSLGKIKIIRTSDLASPEVTRIAIGNPATVPAGRYARQVLEKRGLYDKLSAKLILAENVRQVLDYVARGEVDAGFVFLTDAKVEPKALIAENIPGAEHAPIVYPAAALSNGKNISGAKKFLKFLSSKKGKAAFRRFGFN